MYTDKKNILQLVALLEACLLYTSRWILFSNELSEDFIRRMSIARNIGMILKENSGEEIHSALMLSLIHIFQSHRYSW